MFQILFFASHLDDRVNIAARPKVSLACLYPYGKGVLLSFEHIEGKNTRHHILTNE